MKRKLKKMLGQRTEDLTDKLKISWLKKKMIKAYLKSPPKVQYALAKFGVKQVVNKKKMDIEELIRH